MLRKHDMSVRVGPEPLIRTRRAYFDVRYGQLHVRTAFPATGGFDEQAPLVCLHDAGGGGRGGGAAGCWAGGGGGGVWGGVWPAGGAAPRSVYAPDLPGSGESDPPEGDAALGAAAAVLDLAADLRLRRIDLLGVGAGAGVAIDVARSAPEQVGRIVSVGTRALDRIAAATHPCLVLALDGTRAPPPPGARPRHEHLEWVDAPEYRDRPFLLAPQSLADRVAAFLDRG